MLKWNFCSNFLPYNKILILTSVNYFYHLHLYLLNKDVAYVTKKINSFLFSLLILNWSSLVKEILDKMRQQVLSHLLLSWLEWKCCFIENISQTNEANLVLHANWMQKPEQIHRRMYHVLLKHKYDWRNASYQ